MNRNQIVQHSTLTNVAIFLILCASILMGFSYAISVMAYGQPLTETLPDSICGYLMPNSFVPQVVDIAQNTTKALFILNWTSGTNNLELELIKPLGKNLSQTEAARSKGAAYESYLVSDPEPGAWMAKIKAINVSKAGEEYCLQTKSTGGQAVRISPKPVWPAPSQIARFTQIFSDKGIDRDLNGHVDLIEVKVGLNILVPGSYTVKGSLRDLNGKEIQASLSQYLGIGAKLVPLEFSNSSARGQRVLSSINVYDSTGQLLDHLAEAHTTQSYDDMDLSFSRAKLSQEFADRGTDINGDGLYDFLSIDVGVDIQSPGEFTLTGSLMDAQGKEIVWSIDKATLSAGHHMMQLNFDGKTIEKQGSDGPYHLRALALSGQNWSAMDTIPEAYTTKAYNSSDFVDPAYPEKVLSGSGSGNLLITFTIHESLPVFSGKYSQDIVGINMPPISSNWTVRGENQGYSYNLPGIYMPDKPNDFSVKAEGVKDLAIGLRQFSKPGQRESFTRTWVTTQINAEKDVATAKTNLVSPGSYHVKIFGNAADNVTQVYLTLAVVKKLVVLGPFNLSINTTAFPQGNYSIATKALDGTFQLNELQLDNL